MKVAIFTDSFLPGIGGTEQAVLRYATELSKTDEVMVVAPRYKKAECDDNAFPFKMVRANGLYVTKNDIAAFPSLTKGYYKKIIDFKPDVVHCQTLNAVAKSGNTIAKRIGAKLIYTVHTKFRYCYKEALKLGFLADIVIKFMMSILKKADRVCVVSRTMENELKSYGCKKDMTIIRNGRPISYIQGTPKEKNDDKFEMLFVGSLAKYKNLDFIIDALKIVKKTRDDFTFYVVGTGAAEKYYKKRVKKEGLDKNVIFTGVIADRQKLNELYYKAELFLFASFFDSDGLVLAEAAYQNTPSLILEGTGAAERIVDNETGFIAKDEESYAKKILELMEDKESLIRCGKNAIKAFGEWSDTVKEYKKIYEEPIASK